MGIPADQIMALTQRCAQAEVDRDKARARVAELEAAIHSHKDHYIFTTPDFEDLELWKLVEPKP